MLHNGREEIKRGIAVHTKSGAIALLLGLALALPVQGRASSAHPAKKSRSAGGEVASGTGDIAKGAAKGAVDLVTLHPIDAAVSVGKGGVSAGTHIAVGTTKGTAKIVRGVGKGITHVF